jgi:hypothetical protein
VRFHGNWRWFFDYGTGDLGNDGVHRIDVARWALGTALEAKGEGPLPALPRTVSAAGGKWYFDDAQEWPDTLQVDYQFDLGPGKSGRILTYEMRVWNPYPYLGEGEGVAVFGDEAYVVMGNGGWRVFGNDGKKLLEKSGSVDDLAHMRNFVDCVKSRKKPNADLETVGHPSSFFCHAGNVAWRTGRKLTIDAETETFVGDGAAEANALRTRPAYRPPWVQPEVRPPAPSRASQVAQHAGCATSGATKVKNLRVGRETGFMAYIGQWTVARGWRRGVRRERAADAR